jgi:hypothetical protein
MNKTWEEVVDMDFPPCTEVDQKKLKASFAQIRLFRGCVRMQMGRLVTSQEIADRRRRILRRDLF